MQEFSEQLVEILERITDAFFALDDEWRFTYVNREAERLLNRSREELLGKNVWDEFPRAVGSTFYEQYKALSDQETVEFEEYYPPLETWFEVRAYPSESGLSVYFRNVNARKNAEEALMDSERRLRAVLVQYSSDIITILEADGTVRYESPAVEKVLGYKPEELEGTKIFEHLHPDDIGLVRSALGSTVERPGGWGPVEVRFKHKDGSWRHLEGVGNNLLHEPNVSGLVVNSRDVTERKRAEERVAFQANLLDTIGQAVIATDLRGRITYWNRAAQELYGWSTQEAVGRLVGEVIGDGDQAELAEEIWGELSAGRSWSGEFVVRGRDGTAFRVMVTDTPVYDERGNLVGIIGVSTGITERKQAEERLRASEDELRALFAAMQDVVLVFDARGRYVYIASTDPSRLYKPTSERLGKTVQEVLPKELADTFLDCIRRTLRTRRTTYIEYNMEIEGRQRWFSAAVSPMPEDKVVWVARDITDSKTSQEALKESEERFRQLFEQAVDTLLVHDEAGRIIDCNAEACRSLGYSREEMLSLSVSDFASNLFSGEGRASVSGPLWQHDEAHGFEAPVAGVHLAEHRRKDGTTFPVEVRVSFIDYGGRRMMLASCRDVTKIKRAAEALHESEERFRTAFEDAPIGMALVGFDNRYLRVNSALCEMLGYEEEELLAKTSWEVTHPEDLEKSKARTRQMLEESSSARESLEKRYVCKDGRIVWALSNVSLVRDSGGNPSHFVSHYQDITHRKEAEEALKESEERFRSLIQNASDVIMVVRADGTIAYESPAIERVMGYAPEERIGKNAFDYVHPEDVERVRRSFRRTPAGTSAGPPIEYRVRHADGSWRCVESVANNLIGSLSVEGIIVNSRDITERKRAEETLKESEARFRALAQNASDIITVLEADGTIRYESLAVRRILGYEPGERVGKSAFDHVHPDDAERVLNVFNKTVAKGIATASVEFRFRHADGSWRNLESIGQNLLDDPEVRGVVVTSRDATERKALQRQLKHQAFHDPLTDLPNRALFMDRLGHALERAKRREEKVAVLFMDLDNFKYVNDSLGHEVGDKLLVAAARRIRESIRPGDTVARLGGDEFTVLLEEVGDMSDAPRVAERVVEALQGPFDLQGHELFTGVSIGIALNVTGRERPEDLVRKADLALYEAKREGKARYAMFKPEAERRSIRRLELENDLRRALERDEFAVRYQPILGIDKEQIMGLEALLRWEHPERGLVSPCEFVPLAEETGLIVPIGRWALREACRQAKEWQEHYPHDRSLILGVNLSTVQLQHPDLEENVEEILRETGLNPDTLTLEITESVLVEDANRHLDVLHRLRDLGVRLAIDDFGTGYSSLSYLRRLPVGLLKLDGSFVERIGEEGGEDEVLLSGVIGIAHGLGLRVLAEGVENPQQLRRLRYLGCDLAQGYHFSGPLPPEEMGAFLTKSLLS